MKLFFRHYGKGKPVIILHGLFGMSDNWVTMAKRIAENNFHVIVPDLRNHGQSPHSEEWDYASMSRDVFELMAAEKIIQPVLIGHSMGGKVAMQMVSEHQEKFSGVVVVDIAPKAFPVMHGEILSALNVLSKQIPFARIKAEDFLFRRISDPATVKFLLKNLYWKTGDDGKIFLWWRFNLKTITKKISNIGQEILFPKPIKIPSLFIRGERSDYITDDDFTFIKNHFRGAKLVTINNSGHWVHAENPDEFLLSVLKFLH